jgi:hypothetical protein
MGSTRGADRLEPGQVGTLQRWLDEHDPAGYLWKRQATRLIPGWGMGIQVITADQVTVSHGLERITLTRGPDRRWRALPS